jgi:C1A family cysteine protease
MNGCVTASYNNNHAMVIVGFGHDPVTQLDYWKVRNSWGEEWGEDGYIRIQRGVNMCNVESDAYFLAKPVSTAV